MRLAPTSEAEAASAGGRVWVDLALAWSAVYALLGLFWAIGGDGFPYGTASDPNAGVSILARATADTTAPVIAGLGLIAVVVAWTMRRRLARMRPLLLGLGGVLALGLTLLVPDYRVLMSVAYTPLLLVGSLFGWPEQISIADVFPWSVVNQLIMIAGGLVWAGATRWYWRHTRGACVACGRLDQQAPWTTPQEAVKWGQWATGVAVVIPLVYAATRYAWALGIPLGISEEFFREGQEVGLWVAGAGLATLGVIGAILTLGLIRPWGEVFPRWIPMLGGRTVPVRAATIPAGIVAALVTSAGLMFIRLTLWGDFSVGSNSLRLDENWAALLPELLWPLWGVALGAAALAYHYRRRGRCAVCHRGDGEQSLDMRELQDST